VRMRVVVALCVLLGFSSARVVAKAAPECCKIMGSLDCTACKDGIPLVDSQLRELPPDPKALHLPKVSDPARFNYSPKIMRPRPRIIAAEAEDVTNGAPIACPQGSPNCYRPMHGNPCGAGAGGSSSNFEGHFDLGPGVVGGPCLQPGQNAGPILRPGGAFAPMYPAPYGLPHYPFPPDSQDWTRPAMLSPRPEGEVTEEEGEKLDKNELGDKDGADSR